MSINEPGLQRFRQSAQQGGPPGLDQFMAAIRQAESGGDYQARGPQDDRWGVPLGAYQIMSKIWPEWADRYGYSGASPSDPKAQDAIARARMTDMYSKYGSWPLVAVAWFAGESRAKKARDKGITSLAGISDSLGTSVPDYVKKVISQMGDEDAMRQMEGVRTGREGLPGREQQFQEGQPTPEQIAWNLEPSKAAGASLRAMLDAIGRRRAQQAGGLADELTGDFQGDVPPPNMPMAAVSQIAEGLNQTLTVDQVTLEERAEAFRQSQEAVTSEEELETALSERESRLRSSREDVVKSKTGHVIPVAGVTPDQLRDTFGAPRSGGRTHAGIDIEADHGTPVLAMVSGEVATAGDDGRLGGKRVWIRGDDGYSYYYAHLSRINVSPGTKVGAGQQIGEVGNTGNAASTPPHLHLSINTDVGPEDPVVNPYNVLVR